MFSRCSVQLGSITELENRVSTILVLTSSMSNSFFRLKIGCYRPHKNHKNLFDSFNIYGIFFLLFTHLFILPEICTNCRLNYYFFVNRRLQSISWRGCSDERSKNRSKKNTSSNYIHHTWNNQITFLKMKLSRRLMFTHLIWSVLPCKSWKSFWVVDRQFTWI